MKKLFNWTFGSFFRTLGRFLFYILIGSILVYVGGKLKWNYFIYFTFY